MLRPPLGALRTSARTAPPATPLPSWRRLAAVGWTTLFAFLVHFVLALTGQRRVLAPWFTYLVLHLPAALGSYVFALRGGLAARHADVLAIGSGWTAMVANTTAKWAYFAYCAVTVGSSVALFGRLGARSSDRSVRDACLRAPEREAAIRA